MTKKKKLKREVHKLEAEVKTADAKAGSLEEACQAAEGGRRVVGCRGGHAAEEAEVRTAGGRIGRGADRDSSVAEVSAVEAEQPAVSPESATPDDSWSVTALRTEARSRGLTGYSRKSKADLLAELTNRPGSSGGP